MLISQRDLQTSHARASDAPTLLGLAGIKAPLAMDDVPAGAAMGFDPSLVADAEAGGPALGKLIFGDMPNPEVMRQWKAQPVAFADVDLSDSLGITPFSAGLAQEREKATRVGKH